jgi:hypothetical protein
MITTMGGILILVGCITGIVVNALLVLLFIAPKGVFCRIVDLVFCNEDCFGFLL